MYELLCCIQELPTVLFVRSYVKERNRRISPPERLSAGWTQRKDLTRPCIIPYTIHNILVWISFARVPFGWAPTRRANEKELGSSFVIGRVSADRVPVRLR